MKHLTILALMALTAGMARAETDPQSDLAMMTAKAAGDPTMTEMLRLFSRNPPSDQRRMMMRQYLESFPLARDGSFSQPIHYAIAYDVNLSQRRGQLMGQMLVADLNNDGQITRQEVRNTLEVFPQQGAVAQAFFTSDKNDDGILQSDELRAAVELQVGSMGSQGRSKALRLFDFDDDGYLTPEEFDRATKAFGI